MEVIELRILYFSAMNINLLELSGVAKKIIAQCNAFREQCGENNVYLASFDENNNFVIRGKDYYHDIKYKKSNRRQLRLSRIYPNLAQVIDELSIDVVYFRAYNLTFQTIKLFKKIKSFHVKIYMEIPTYPFWKEKRFSIINNLKRRKIVLAASETASMILYGATTLTLKKYIDVIVTFSNIKSLWGIPVLGISNGYDFENTLVSKKNINQDSKYHLLVVASIRRNHGIDRIIESIYQFRKDTGINKFVLHVVGTGDALDELKNQVRSMKDYSDSIIFHGAKYGHDLESVYDISDVGISALGFHRFNVGYISPLKSKEYFAKGLPCVGTENEEDIIFSSAKKYFFTVSADDSNIDMNKLLDFCKEMESIPDINNKIHITTKEIFDWRVIMKLVVDSMKE